MNVNNVLVQIGMLAVALGIGYTYVYPTILSIGDVQDSIINYTVEREKIVDVNVTLERLRTTSQEISADDLKRLEEFLPTKLDDVAIVRDVIGIADVSGVVISAVDFSLSTTQSVSLAGVPEPVPQAAEVSVTVDGTYEQIKTLLYLFELNNYPLLVKSLMLTAQEGGLITADITLATYQFKSSLISS